MYNYFTLLFTLIYFGLKIAVMGNKRDAIKRLKWALVCVCVVVVGIYRRNEVLVITSVKCVII